MKFPTVILRLAWTGQLREKSCEHLDYANEARASSEGCEECLELARCVNLFVEQFGRRVTKPYLTVLFHVRVKKRS